MFQSKIKNRVYLALIATSLAAGKALAEDDVVDYDPNNPFIDTLRDFWQLLTQLLA